MGRREVLFLGTAAVWLGMDQASKFWIEANLAFRFGEIQVIPGFFSIVHAQNPGAAFGLLGGFANRQVVFGIFTVVAMFIVADIYRKLKKDAIFMPIALGLVLSGALGNAIDRVRQQHVTDFIRIYSDHASLKQWLINNFGTYEWPSFNIADTALVIGVCMFIIYSIFLEEKEEKGKKEDGKKEEPVVDGSRSS